MAKRTIHVNDLALLFKLPSWEDFFDANRRYPEKEAEEAFWKAAGEQRGETWSKGKEGEAYGHATEKLFEAWRDAVWAAAKPIFEYHHLKLKLRKWPRRHQLFLIEPIPRKAWIEAAARLEGTIRKADVEVPDLAELKGAPMKWVLGHLTYIELAPQVWPALAPMRAYRKALA